jgi:hypothetical protein
LLDLQQKEEEKKAKGNKDALMRIQHEYQLKSIQSYRDYRDQQLTILESSSTEIEAAHKAELSRVNQLQKDAIDGWLESMRDARKQDIKESKDNMALIREEEKLKQDLLRDSITATMELTRSLYELFFKKLEEKSEEQKRIESEALAEVEDKEKAGVLTKMQAEEEKARISLYYESVQQELMERQKRAERDMFLLQQAITIAEIWFSTAKNIASPIENPLKALTGMHLAIAAAQTAIVAAQAIPMFAEGGTMEKTGKAVLGDGGKNELGILPDGRFFVTPDIPTMYHLPKDTRILPDVNAIDIHSLIGMKQAMPQMSQGHESMAILRSIDRSLKSQKGGNFYGMPLIKQISQSERYSYRKRGLMN